VVTACWPTPQPANFRARPDSLRDCRLRHSALAQQHHWTAAYARLQGFFTAALFFSFRSYSSQSEPYRDRLHYRKIVETR
jgi:hypothetical protein